MADNFFEPLEQRQLLSITWANRGKSDAFDKFYGDNATVARQIVDVAIADWNKVLPAANAKLHIAAADLSAGRSERNLLGVTGGTSIRLDRWGGSSGWYFDKNLAADTEFVASTYIDLYAASGNFPGRDFYSTAAHEIGHALGFADAKNPFRVTAGNRTLSVDPHHSANYDDLMYPVLEEGERRLISPYDALHTTAGRRAKSAVVSRTFFSASIIEHSHSLAVRWTVPGNVQIYCSTDGPITDPAASGVTLVATVGPDQTTYTDASAETGQTYYYFIVLTDNGINVRAATDGSTTGTAPIDAEASQDTGVPVVTWQTVPGVKFYTVYRSSTDDITKSDALGTRPGSDEDTSWTDMDSDFGKGYYYWVAAPSVGEDGRVTELWSDVVRSYRTPMPRWPDASADDIDGVLTLTLSLPQYVEPDPELVRHDIYRSDTYNTNRIASNAVYIGSVPPSGGTLADPTAAVGQDERYWIETVYQPFADMTVSLAANAVIGRHN